MKLKLALVAALIASPILFSAAQARADEEIPTAPPCAPTKSTPEAAATPSAEWYGWQILVADLGSVTLATVGGIGARNVGAVVTSAVTYLGVSPTIHAVHGNAGAALGSLGLRLALPLGGAALGATLGRSSESGERKISGYYFGGLAGLVVGVIATSFVDAGALGRTSKSPEVRPVGKIDWRPNVGVSRGGAEVGVSGAF